MVGGWWIVEILGLFSQAWWLSMPYLKKDMLVMHSGERNLTGCLNFSVVLEQIRHTLIYEVLIFLILDLLFGCIEGDWGDDAREDSSGFEGKN